MKTRDNIHRTVMSAVLLALSMSLCSFFNVSVEPYGYRSSIQLGRILADYWGIDSLTRFTENGYFIRIKASVDSTGRIKELERAWINKRPIKEKHRYLDPDDLKTIERMMIDAGTHIPAYCEASFPVPPNVNRADFFINLASDYLKGQDDGRIPVEFSFPDGLTAFGNQQPQDIKKYLQRMMNDLGAYPNGVWRYGEKYPTVLWSNDAIFLMSMLYVYGDCNVDRWLDKYNFVIEAIVNNDGRIGKFGSVSGSSPLTPDDVALLEHFMKNNNVRLILPPVTSENTDQVSIPLHFPSDIYSDSIKSQPTVPRMRSLDFKLRYPDLPIKGF